jgi:signal transduction histidine kinase
LAAQVAHQDRLASIGRLAAGIAHEIGNPLTGIACIAQNLVHEEDLSIVRERVGSILDQARRIDGIVRGLLSFSRTGADSRVQEVETLSIREVVGEAIALVQLDRAAKDIPCENNCPADLMVEGDRQRLLQVFVNLLSNAFDASRAGNRVWVEAKAQGGGVRILIIDQGTGIPEPVKQRIFEPFFTTKELGQGTGLGLPLAYNIVREHEGTMEVNSAFGAGTTVILELPLRQKSAPPSRLDLQREQVRA